MNAVAVLDETLSAMTAKNRRHDACVVCCDDPMVAMVEVVSAVALQKRGFEDGKEKERTNVVCVLRLF